ncbi:MAG: hypothetical protein QNJ36_20460 [Calothrix sp. MO_167.B42]|nr:hypothetical protein [Calothrix sp. MO_167.B42]
MVSISRDRSIKAIAAYFYVMGLIGIFACEEYLLPTSIPAK